MMSSPQTGKSASRGRVLAGGGVLAVLALAAVYAFFPRPTPEGPAAPATVAPPVEATTEQVHQFCGRCHAYPPPETFPRAAWRKEVKQGYDFFHQSRLRIDYPSIESVALYYEKRAPLALPPLVQTPPSTPPVRFRRAGYRPPGDPVPPGVTNVNLVRLFDRTKLDVLVCDARRGQVLAFSPYKDPPGWQILGRARAPARTDVIDLDGDHVADVLVADLGSFSATDTRLGRVVWLRGSAGGTFQPLTLLDGVGRVADVRAADFTGTGRQDLVVAVFGWRNNGEVLYLENRTTDWARPVFVPRVLDDRHGAIRVCVGDVNGDGRPDVVALISQEHETIFAFVNEGGGKFRKETIYAAPHPGYGSSGIQLVDLNGDGRLDVLYTNGDVLDPPHLLKPYHGVQWLENHGRFPFEHHPLAAMYGAACAVAADLRGTGRPAVVAVSCLPADEFPQRAARKLDSVLLLEQTRPGHFVPHSLETVTCDHFTCALGPLEGGRTVHLVTGNFSSGGDTITVWRNLGTRRPPR